MPPPGNAEVLVSRPSPFHPSLLASEFVGWEDSNLGGNRNGRNSEARETLITFSRVQGPFEVV